jgi:hypothetical protein
MIPLACRDSEGRLVSPVGPVACEARIAGRAAVVSGTVRTAEQMPVPDARVTIGEAIAITDSNGRFTLSDLQSGPTAYQVETPAQGLLRAVLVIVPGPNSVALFVKPFGGDGLMFGRILDACTGSPIGGATIKTPLETGLSAADGTYRVRTVAGGSWVDYTFSHPAYQTSKLGGPPMGSGAYSRDVFLSR